MIFVVRGSPDPWRWPCGTLMTLEHVAELTENNAAEMRARRRVAFVFEDQGFRFEIMQGSDAWQSEG